MKTTTALIFLSTLFISMNAYSATWMSFGDAGDIGYYDKDSLSMAYFDDGTPYVSINTQHRFGTTDILPTGVVYDTIQTTMYYDCQRQKLTFGSGIFLRHGHQVDDYTRPLDKSSSQHWHKVGTGEVGQAQLYQICAIK